MEHFAAFMILIACSDDVGTCSERPSPAVAFESLKYCEMELAPAIRETDGNSAKAFGRCIQIDPTLLDQDLEIVWDVTEADGLEVAVNATGPEINVRSVAETKSHARQIRLN